MRRVLRNEFSGTVPLRSSKKYEEPRTGRSQGTAGNEFEVWTAPWRVAKTSRGRAPLDRLFSARRLAARDACPAAFWPEDAELPGIRESYAAYGGQEENKYGLPDLLVLATAWPSVWNPNRFKIPSTWVFRNEFLGALPRVVENSGSEYERSKNRGKRVRFDGGRDF